MAFMAAALPYIAAGVTAVSAIQSASAQASAQRYNSRVAQMNAQAALEQGKIAEDQQHREVERRLGQMRANYAASGVDVGVGSPLDVLGDSAAQAEQDRLNLRYNYQMRATGFSNQANLDEMAASNAQTSGYLNAAGGAMGAYSRTGGTTIPNYGKTPSTAASE